MLVCTTIIESGLDIPNVNTIIINHADKFGLAQLYQLRGRVGRGAARAYAYLLYETHTALTEVAQKRLQAIFEATELGAGLQIALQDLEIRGAGNLLGAEQSGHIGGGLRPVREAAGRGRRRAEGAAAGRDAAAVAHRAAGDGRPAADGVHPGELRPRPEPAAGAVPAHGRAPTGDAAADLEQEMSDRFGPPPAPVRNLLYIVRVRELAKDSEHRRDRARGTRGWPQRAHPSRPQNDAEITAQMPPSMRRELGAQRWHFDRA